mgnify:CR=1 FL=1
MDHAICCLFPIAFFDGLFQPLGKIGGRRAVLRRCQLRQLAFGAYIGLVREQGGAPLAAMAQAESGNRDDLEILLQLSGKMVHPLFDTQVAAMVCGYGEQVGYEALVNDIARLHRTHPQLTRSETLGGLRVRVRFLSVTV